MSRPNRLFQLIRSESKANDIFKFQDAIPEDQIIPLIQYLPVKGTMAPIVEIGDPTPMAPQKKCDIIHKPVQASFQIPANLTNDEINQLLEDNITYISSRFIEIEFYEIFQLIKENIPEMFVNRSDLETQIIDQCEILLKNGYSFGNYTLIFPREHERNFQSPLWANKLWSPDPSAQNIILLAKNGIIYRKPLNEDISISEQKYSIRIECGFLFEEDGIINLMIQD